MRRLVLLWPVLLSVGCFDTQPNALFKSAAGAGGSESPSTLGGASGAASGTDSGSSAGTAPLGGASNVGGVTGTAAAGSAGSSIGGGGGATSDGGGGQAVVVPVIEDCSMLEAATTSELDGHCYRVSYQNLTFAAARDACGAAGGHLVSIGSDAENELVAQLHDGEHWIGATDGRSDMTPGVGPYVWVDGAEWTYSRWESGQPNAYETDCPGGEDADCFEHCAFQSDEGDWNDRSCWHTLVSVCEWDVEKADDGGDPQDPNDPGAAAGASSTP